MLTVASIGITIAASWQRTAVSSAASPRVRWASAQLDADSSGVRAGVVLLAGDPFAQPAPAMRDSILARPPSMPPIRALPRLTAIVGGPPWRVVLDNLPGVDGSRVLHSGDSVSTVRVLAIDARRVVLRVADSSVTLWLR
ncbi:MAG: hypothetical protein HY275_13355 [Gemmatimonadetes bacterium]|nr:hypothetical protein [Gemmatimonadota bacterium]